MTQEKMRKENRKLTARDIALIGVMVAIIEVCKVTMAYLPNIELTSFWMIMFTIFFGWKVVFVVPVFILIEGCMYGFGLWWVMYLYAWPLLAFIAYKTREQESVWFWSMLSGMFGLFFGFLCAIPYFVIGFVDGGFTGGMYAGFSYWVAGIPFDITHAIANFVLMLVLYTPVRKVMKRVSVWSGQE